MFWNGSCPIAVPTLWTDQTLSMCQSMSSSTLYLNDFKTIDAIVVSILQQIEDPNPLLDQSKPRNSLANLEWVLNRTNTAVAIMLNLAIKAKLTQMSKSVVSHIKRNNELGSSSNSIQTRLRWLKCWLNRLRLRHFKAEDRLKWLTGSSLIQEISRSEIRRREYAQEHTKPMMSSLMVVTVFTPIQTLKETSIAPVVTMRVKFNKTS